MWILKCNYSDGGIVRLGTQLKQIKKALSDFYEDMNDEEYGNEESIKLFNKLLSFNSAQEIYDFHEENFDSDFHMEYI